MYDMWVEKKRDQKSMMNQQSKQKQAIEKAKSQSQAIIVSMFQKNKTSVYE